MNKMKNGNYILSRWNSWNYDVAFIPENADRLFDLNRDKCNVLVYLDKYKLEDRKNLGMYLALNLAKNIDFNVVISTNYDASVSEDADVIINGFDSRSRDFIKELERYDDGSKLFVSSNDFNSITSREIFLDFVRKIKNDLVDLEKGIKMEIVG